MNFLMIRRYLKRTSGVYSAAKVTIASGTSPKKILNGLIDALRNCLLWANKAEHFHPVVMV